MSGHYLRERESWSAQVIILFNVFVLLFVLSGAWLFWLKTGFTVSGVMEYYAGSETALRYYPDMPDRFINPKTIQGLSKVVLPHMLVYGLVVFITGHLLLSLSPGRINRYAVGTAFVFAVLDIFAGFLPLLLSPLAGSFIRLVFFYGFTLSVIFLAARLGLAVLKSS